MKKSFIYIIAIITALLVLLFILYVMNEYGVNIIKYFSYLEGLTEAEQEWLGKHGNLIFGSDYNAPPLKYYDVQSGQYKGIAVDYMRAISIELGAEVDFKPIAPGETLRSLAEGKTDISDIIPSKESEKYFLLSDPIYNLRGVALVSSEEREIKNYNDLEGKRVAVTKGHYSIDFLKQNGFNIDYVYVKDDCQAIELLRLGKVRAILGDEPVISYFIEKLDIKEDVQILGEMFEVGYVLAVDKSNPTLLKIINKGIFNLKRKNILGKIQQKWFGISAPISREKISEKLQITIVITAMLILVASYVTIVWNNMLKEEVKKKTEELQMSKNDLQIILDGLSHFIFVLDKNCNIVNTNKSFCKYLNITKNKVIGRHCSEITDITGFECQQCIVPITFTKGIQMNNEIENSGRVLKFNTIPLKDKNSEETNVIVVIEDITDIKANERQLLQANKMAAVGQLAAGVAHEIRNPLGIIRNYIYVIKTSITQMDERIKKSIETMETSVDRVSHIINNLLNFSRIASENYQWVNIRQIIENILELENKVMVKKNIKYILECNDELTFYTISESMKHILINLISNAIDAMSKGGILEIKCREEKHGLVLQCSDTGIGINSEDLEKIFDPFFTKKASGNGTGLGLYITYNEVQKMGGNIRVCSKVGEGTIFEVFLPLRTN